MTITKSNCSLGFHLNFRIDYKSIRCLSYIYRYCNDINNLWSLDTFKAFEIDDKTCITWSDNDYVVVYYWYFPHIFRYFQSAWGIFAEIWILLLLCLQTKRSALSSEAPKYKALNGTSNSTEDSFTEPLTCHIISWYIWYTCK